MSHEQQPTPPGRQQDYRAIWLAVRLLNAALVGFVLTRTSDLTPFSIRVVLVAILVAFVALAIWSIYDLFAHRTAGVA